MFALKTGEGGWPRHPILDTWGRIDLPRGLQAKVRTKQAIAHSYIHAQLDWQNDMYNFYLI